MEAPCQPAGHFSEVIFFHTNGASSLNYDKIFFEKSGRGGINTGFKDILSLYFVLAILLTALPLHTILKSDEEKKCTGKRTGSEC